MGVADYCAEFRVLYSCCTVGRHNSDCWCVNDSEDMCIFLDCLDWLFHNEKGTKIIKAVHSPNSDLYLLFSLEADAGKQSCWRQPFVLTITKLRIIPMRREYAPLYTV